MPQQPSQTLSNNARITILAVAFLGWFFGGMQIGITNLMRPAAIGLMNEAGWTTGLGDEARRAMADEWFAYFQCAFLFGAAAGGFVFGKLGDRIGRTKALGISIVWFSVLTGAAYFARDPTQLLVLRFLACMGVGGCWPNGVVLVSEAWANIARPIMASLIGMAGNVGIFTFASLAESYPITPESWRWALLVGATPTLLGLIIWLFVKESPGWLAARNRQRDLNNMPSIQVESPPSVFRKPYLGVTLVGIALATVPLFGGWGSFNWMVAWAGQGPPELKAQILQMRSITSIFGSGLAAVIAMLIGRRICYFVTSLAALLIAQYAFWFTTPTDDGFLFWVALWGFFNGIFFGWLPFFLPELFETRIRSTGAGVSFNYGRILTATTIFLTPHVAQAFGGSYSDIGRWTSLIFLLGMIAILFAPDTSKRDMDE